MTLRISFGVEDVIKIHDDIIENTVGIFEVLNNFSPYRHPSILPEILESSPLSFKECSSFPLILEGPISMSKRLTFSKSQEELDRKFFPENVKELGLEDLRIMARGLRKWARGASLIEQHKRRMQASLAHHILKLCDITAASGRPEFREEPENPFGGWLMSQKIENYVRRLKGSEA